METNDFRQFIISLLKRGNIKKSRMGEFTGVKCLKMFQTAFTHKTYDADDNYELVELIGDSIVNYSVIRYLREWDSKIVSVKYLTRLKHNITSKKELALIAEKAGFFKYIRMGEDLTIKFQAMNQDFKHNNKDYKSILEDSFEAFIGTVSILVDKETGVSGTGTEIGYRIIKSFLKESSISLDYKDVFDAKTRYKELCDKRGWDFKHAMNIQEVNENKRYFKVEVIGYPYGNKVKNENNKAVLAHVVGPIKVNVQNNACSAALKILEGVHNIYDLPPNPYKQQN